MKSIFEFEVKYRIQLVWTLRFLIAVLFILSAVAKLMPIEIFEKQLINISNKPGPLEGFTNWCNVTVWSRTIIISEIFLGLSILIPYYQRTITIPLSIAMLLVFILHLFYQIMVFGNDGNCGCMGELIPMSPLSAIIKNLVTIILLVYLFFSSKICQNEKPTFHFLMLPAVILSIFLFNPIEETICGDKQIKQMVNQESQLVNNRIDTLINYLNEQNSNKVDSVKGKSVNPIIPLFEVPSKISEYHDYQKFNLNGKTVSVSLDKGKKIVCVLNPDCDHCKNLIKQLKSIKTNQMADIHLLFCNPDNSNDIDGQIQLFLKEVGISAMWSSIDIKAFTRLLENASYPPRLSILENGNIVYDYLGEGDVDVQKIKNLGKK